MTQRRRVPYNTTRVPNKNWEPFLHGISILIPLLLGITALSRKGFNTYGAICFLEPNNPPHCVSCSVTGGMTVIDYVKSGDNDESDILWSGKDFAIPCGRGIE